MGKTTNQDLMAALATLEDLMTTKSNELTEKVEALDVKVSEMAARRSPGRKRDDRRFRCTDTQPPGRETAIDVVLWKSLKDLDSYSREEMNARTQELIDAGSLRTRRAAKDIVNGTLPWALREGYVEVVDTAEAAAGSNPSQ